MEKIEFKEGELVKSATVTIDGTEHEVKEAEYTGETPLSPFVLNKMQNNIEESAVAVSTTEPTTGEKVWFNPHNSKNELDISKAVFKIAISVTNGAIGESEHYCSCEEYIEVKSNTSYTFSANRSLFDIRLFEYDKNYNFIKANRLQSVDSVSGTTSAEAKYVRWSINYDGKELTLEILKTLELQIEEGTIRTQYQEYSNPTIFVKNGNGIFEEFINIRNLVTYSNQEKIVGIWIDKKPLYQIVVSGVLPKCASSGTAVSGTIAVIENTKMRKILECWVENQSGDIYPLPFLSGTGQNGYLCKPIFLGTGEFTIQNANVNMNNQKVFAVLQYTKTTD